MRLFLTFNIVLIFTSYSFAQNLDQEGFIKALAGDGDIRQYVSEEELQSSERLGITYYGEKDKFLIGYELPEEIKEMIRAGSNYELSYPMTGNGYGALTLSVPSENFKQIFYFKNDKYISPLTFHTRNYTKKESDFFRFYIDDTTYFNDYCKEKLDEYVDRMLNLMEFTALEREILINEKFIYVLCKDNEEIKQVTGYDTRGMYVTGYDAVVTTFNTHYHEVAHGLMYFKQKTDIKPELLFFQEGFATAMGGRGGEDYKVNISLGFSLYNSKLVTLDEIFSNADFINAGASISYNLGAFINRFLLSKDINFNKYFELYTKYSGTREVVNNFSIKDFSLPDIDLDEYKKSFETVTITGNDNGAKEIQSKDDVTIDIIGLDYGFKTKQSFLLSEKEPLKSYFSNKFAEIFPGREYKGEKYYIWVNEDGVSVYNLYTNEMIAMYAKGFSENGEPVPVIDGYYKFYIPGYVFDEYIGELTISK